MYHFCGFCGKFIEKGSDYCINCNRTVPVDRCIHPAWVFAGLAIVIMLIIVEHFGC